MGQIEGTVTVFGQPTSDALISIDGTGLSATPNMDGFYRFPSLLAGTYVVRAALPGFQVQTVVIDLQAGETEVVNFAF
jgi:hypothetical protein